MKKDIYKYCVLVLDFGSQYTQLIVRRIREFGVYCELRKWNITEVQIRELKPNGIILSGSPESVTKSNSPRVSKYVFEAGIPVLGICYGMQVMAKQLGGTVKSSRKREFGYTKLEIKNNSILLHGYENSIFLKNQDLLDVWMSHNDKVTAIPTNFITIASTKTCPFAIIENKEKQLYGVQFHPEVTHSRNGSRILKHFIYDICQCKAFWRPEQIIDNIIDYIRQKVNNNKIILGFSGGVDSSVTAMLLQRAIGKNLTCIFVDNGLLRLNERKEVIDTFSKQFGLNIIYVSAEERFFRALKCVKDPEIKRKVIGRLFVKIFEEEALKIKGEKWFAQGTIYPDVIESTALSVCENESNIIKSHHNVGGLPNKMNMNLIEPLRNLFKDEVRKIGLKIGIPKNILYRHPFPGPGLSVRVLGEVKKEYCDLLRMVDAIFLEELRKAKLYNKISQAFSVFLPIRSVGVMGDIRKYGWVVSLRAVETIDFMTARCARLPFDLLMRISNRITNEVNGISRVVYDISDKPPATIEWE